ncbi:hypothetical protein OEZ86_014193 [Tetradesmus obliquus]|nr:hypothetical protein OEZ86_014193 [Tetradesmus obliquus]
MLLGILRRLLPVHDISSDYEDPPQFLQGKQTRPQLQAAPPAQSSCSVCQQTGCTIRCFTCNPAAECHVLLCDSCDTQRHAAAHLHDRQQYVTAGHWQDLPRADTAAGYFPFKPTSCTGCRQSGCFEAEPCALQPLDYITRDGIVEAKRAGFKCTSCSTVVWQQPEDFLRVRAWPASLSASHVRTVVDVALLQLWDSMRLCNPTISLSGFLKGIVDAAAVLHPTQPRREINMRTFRSAHREYKFCQTDLRLGLQLLNDLECPACSEGMAGVHIDANMKLFTWLRHRELWRQQHYSEFFAADASVQLSLRALDLAMGSTCRVPDNVCNGLWAAASDGQQRRQAQQEITGRCVATDARHGGPIAAANLIGSGERYGYAFHIAAQNLMTSGLQQLHIDIMWWTSGCAKTLGEECEQLFSYLSRFSGTTRNQSSAGSSDALTEAALHFGRQKRAKQALLLVQRYKKFKEQETKAEAELQKQLASLEQTPPQDREQLVRDLHDELRAMARDEVKGDRSQQQKLLQQFADAVRARDAHALSAYMSAATLGSGVQQVLASRVIAGVWDANTYLLHDMATKLVVSAQTSRLQAEAANQLIEQNFAPAVQASLARLQNTIESTCYNLKKQEVKRAAVAAEPKERKRCNKKCAEITKNLAKLVEQYNLLVQQYNAIPQQQQQLQPTTLDALKKQEFCWANEHQAQQGGKLRLYGVARSIALCEADNEVPAEAQVPAAQLQAAAGGVVAAGYVQLSGTGRYQASAVQLLESGRAVSGALSYVRLGGLEAQQLLSRSLRLFGSLQVDGVLNGHVDAEQEEPDSEGSGYAPDSDDEVIAVTA